MKLKLLDANYSGDEPVAELLAHIANELHIMNKLKMEELRQQGTDVDITSDTPVRNRTTRYILRG